MARSLLIPRNQWHIELITGRRWLSVSIDGIFDRLCLTAKNFNKGTARLHQKRLVLDKFRTVDLECSEKYPPFFQKGLLWQPRNQKVMLLRDLVKTMNLTLRQRDPVGIG